MRLILAVLLAAMLCGPGWASSEVRNFTPLSRSAAPVTQTMPADGHGPLIAWCSGNSPTCCKINKSYSTCLYDEGNCISRGGIVVKRDAPGC